jgi:hypothetical protein
MRDETAPMPPTGLLSEEETAVLDAWVAAGMPRGSCETKPDPTPVQLTCTSGVYWTEGDDEGDKLMTPGQACITCHTQIATGHNKDDDDDDDDDDGDDDGDDDAPLFTFAGTVYPTLYEPDDCFGVNGTSTGAKVVLEGADGRTLTLDVNRSGNFMTEVPLALPYTASVTRNGKTAKMTTPQTNGDCNTCHSERAGEAGGRITPPAL